jgi:hypothetical protein
MARSSQRREQQHHRQAVDEASRSTNRDASEAGGDGVNTQVAATGSLFLAASSQVRRGWAEDDVDLAEGGDEIILD